MSHTSQVVEQLKQNDTTLTSLDLSNTTVGVEGIRRIADALKNNTSLTMLNLGNNSIGTKGSMRIGRILENRTALAYLYLGDNLIQYKGAIEIAKGLQQNRSLTSLDLRNCSLGSAGAIAIAKTLKKQQQITTLILRQNNISIDGVTAVFENLMLHMTLTTLDMGNNQICDEGAQTIKCYIENNDTLTTLILSDNLVTDEGAKGLALALCSNSSLKELALERNNIGEVGVTALANGLEENTTLAILNLGDNLPNLVTRAKEWKKELVKVPVQVEKWKEEPVQVEERKEEPVQVEQWDKELEKQDKMKKKLEQLKARKNLVQVGEREKELEKQEKMKKKLEQLKARKKLLQLKKRKIAPKQVKEVSGGNSTPRRSRGKRELGELVIDLDDIIGTGSGGTFVFKGTWSGREVAVKQMHFASLESEEAAEREVSILSEIDHPNLVKYFTQKIHMDSIYLVFDYCPMNLETWLGTLTEFPSEKILELFGGISALHSLDIVHRDIKPNNVLVSAKDIIRVADMGICKRLGRDQQSFTGNTNSGTFGWQSPEQIMRQRQTKKTDIFSLGCLVFYCISLGHHPFGDDIDDRRGNIRSDTPCFSALPTGSLAVDLTKRMICNNPEERWSIEQCFEHPLFWDTGKKFNFLCTASQALKQLKINPTPDSRRMFKELNSKAKRVTKRKDWRTQLCTSLTNSLFSGTKGGTYQKDIAEIVRALRNTRIHFYDSPAFDDFHQEIGKSEADLWNYWEANFPQLLLVIYELVVDYFLSDIRFKTYFA